MNGEVKLTNTGQLAVSNPPLVLEQILIIHRIRLARQSDITLVCRPVEHLIHVTHKARPQAHFTRYISNAPVCPGLDLRETPGALCVARLDELLCGSGIGRALDGDGEGLDVVAGYVLCTSAGRATVGEDETGGKVRGMKDTSRREQHA